MIKKEQYAGIDYFRVIAAILVVAIHISPLSGVNETADFILTRIIARVAVPFFLMTSGFFLIPRYLADGKPKKRGRLAAFLKKAVILYGIAILLYLPVNIYTGYFKEPYWVSKLLKDIVFDGTFYHLWYLPAAMLGAFLTCLLLKKLKMGQVFAITLMLYLVGLLGDSYYGLATAVPLFKTLFDVLFMFFDYTRNGLFFAPIFFLLGGLIAKQRERFGMLTYVTGLIFSLLFMIAEGMVLHANHLQRHDSMYLMLLPCMFFLFQCLLSWKGRGGQILRDLSMTIYLIHPLMIIAVRGFAKVLKLQSLLIDNRILYFMGVAVSSFAISSVIVVLLDKVRHRKKDETVSEPEYRDRAWAEIDWNHLKHNVEILKTAMPQECKLMAVVKANAYGHGDVKVAGYLNEIGVSDFAVATIDEGIHLRTHNIRGNILILGYTDPQRSSELVGYRLVQTVADYKHARQLNATQQRIEVHIKVDSGMHRLGEDCANMEEIAEIFQLRNLKVSGIFTHLCVSDSTRAEDIAFTNAQLQQFYSLLKDLKQRSIALPKIHIQSSYGILNYPEVKCDYARIGIALYGALSSPGDKTKIQADLSPVLSLKTRVALIRQIASGESVSYGRMFTAARNTRIAVLPIGYADGIPRDLSNGKGGVLIHGHRAPIIGRICMDQLMVDITDISDVKRGDVATLIGQDGCERISAEEMAGSAGTITNELLSRLGERLERIYF